MLKNLRPSIRAVALLTTAAVSAPLVVQAGAAQSRARQGGKSPGTPVQSYKVIRTYPHDRQAFTQGLVYLDGLLYEGTGLNGRSGIRRVRLETGEVLQIRMLDNQYFGEGIAVWKNRIVQLTWQHGIGFVYDLQTFEPQRTFTYTGEGWGLTHDGTRLIMSDGSAGGTLRFLDPETLRQTGTLTVRDGSTPVAHLNELEYIKGEIYANVWTTERIARINPKTGRVTAWIDLRGLRGLLDPHDSAGVDVLNGIAYDAAKDRLFVTGKQWPKIFEIQIVP